MTTDQTGLDSILDDAGDHGTVLFINAEAFTQGSVGHIVPLHITQAGVQIACTHAIGLVHLFADHFLAGQCSLCHLPQQAHDALLHRCQLGIDLGQRPRRLVLEAFTSEIDLVADLADAAVLLIKGVAINPGIIHVRPHFA